MLSSLRVLCQVDLPGSTLRWYDGSGGPFMDDDGFTWHACEIKDDALQQIQMAINAEAYTLELALNGIPSQTSDEIWADYQSGQVKGSRFRLFIQKCNERDQPYGAPVVKFTGRIDNLTFTEAVEGEEITSLIGVEIVNRFSLRKMINESVLSDTNQRLRSLKLNPSAGGIDKFLERVITLLNKTIRWPNW